MNNVDAIQYIDNATEKLIDITAIIITIILDIILGLISPFCGVGAVLLNFCYKNVVIIINAGITKYNQLPLVIAFNGVVPSINPNDLPSNITGTLLIAS